MTRTGIRARDLAVAGACSDAYCPCVSAPEKHLRRWQAAGLLDEATAERLRRFEAERSSREREDRPGILEAVVYLGVAVVAVGVAVLIGSSWDELQEWARIAVVAGPAVAALLAGFALRATGQPELVRGGHLAWLVATVLSGVTAGVIADMSDANEDTVFHVSAIVACVVALTLWVVAPSHIQVFALAVALFFLTMAAGTLPDAFDAVLTSLMALGFGAAGLALAEAGLLPPLPTARVMFGLLLAWGGFFGGFEAEWLEAAAFVVAGALIVVSIARGVFVYMVLGLLLGFAALVRAIAMHVEDPTAAALALIVVGVLIVGSIILLARFRARRTASAT